jgi:hypothetical protein
MSSNQKADSNAEILRSIDDVNVKLDAILTAMILPNLGENKKQIKEEINARIKGDLARSVWNSINGQRSLAEIGKKLKRKPQVVLNYIKRWEQDTPPLVYVCMKKDDNKIYKRIIEINLKKPTPQSKGKVPTKETQAVAK